MRFGTAFFWNDDPDTDGSDEALGSFFAPPPPVPALILPHELFYIAAAAEAAHATPADPAPSVDAPNDPVPVPDPPAAVVPIVEPTLVQDTTPVFLIPDGPSLDATPDSPASSLPTYDEGSGGVYGRSDYSGPLLVPADGSEDSGIGMSVRSVSNTSAIGTTGNFTNQDVNGLLTGIAWNATNLTFSFPTASSNYGTSGTYGDPAPFNGFQILSSAQQNVVRYALGLVSQYTNLTFTEITETDSTHATLRFADSASPSTSYAYYPSTSATGGDAFYGNIRNTPPTKAGYEFDTIMHEIGHTLGLKHGQEDDGVHGTLPTAHNATDWSIMDYHSYIGADLFYRNFEGSGNQTYMIDDISALQYMYGANFNTHSGNDVYTWSPTTGEMFIDGVGQGASSTNTVYEALWDGNGTDTYDLSNYSTNLSIDLLPGDFSTFSTSQLAYLDVQNSLIRAPGNLQNANEYNNDPRSLIENAKGGSGDDHFVGNADNNAIDGGAGNNTMAYSHPYSEYNITWSPLTDAFTVADTSGFDGTDTLTNIEHVAFSDQTIDLDPANGIVTNTSVSGGRTTVTQTDLGGTLPWTTIATTHDAQGSIASQTLVRASGVEWDNTYDTANGNTWAWTSAAYNPAHAMTSILTALDNGTYTLGMFDTTNSYSWTNATITFDANWNVTAVTGTSDDGHTPVTMATIAIAFDTLLWFTKPYDPNFGGAAENLTLTGGSNADFLYGHDGNDALSGGGGNDYLNGGHGNDLLSGGSGIDTFAFNFGDGLDTVTDFTHGTDIITLHNYGVTSFAALQPLMSQFNSTDTLIAFDDQNHILLQNVQMSSLTAGDFVLS